MIQQISEHYISRLPQSHDFYKTQYLQEYGFPSFLVRQISMELKKKVAESMRPPQTQWVDMQAAGVQQSWQQLQKIMQAEAKIPAHAIQGIMEKAVSQIIELLTQPRKMIPDILFEVDEVLTAQELAVRLGKLVVYPHFAKVLISYMERKKRDTLDRSRCRQIIGNVDEKLTSHYSPLQWAQLLDPLFTLAGRRVDTELFRLFFEDKGMKRAARKFELIDDAINHDQFIEALSSAELLEWEGYESDQPELFDSHSRTDRPNVILDAPVATDADFSENRNQADEADKIEPVETKTEAASAHPTPKEEETKRLASADGSSKKVSDSSPQKTKKGNSDNDNNGYRSLNTIFEQEGYAQEGPSPQVHSLNELFTGDGAQKEEQKTELQKTPPASANKQSKVSPQRETVEPDKPSRQEAAPSSPEKPQGSVPIWQQFSSDENQQKDNGKAKPHEEAAKAVQPSTTFESKPQPEPQPKFDPQPQPQPQSDQDKIAQLLGDKKNYFVRHLFKGSGQAYEKFIREMADQDNWKGASMLIKRDIFERDGVNMYSEAAVELTDRLQTHFARQ